MLSLCVFIESTQKHQSEVKTVTRELKYSVIVC